MPMKKIVLASFLATAEGGGGHRRGFGASSAFVQPSSAGTKSAFVQPANRRQKYRITPRFANEQDNDDGNILVKNDFPAWVKALTKWDTPSSSSEPPSSPPNSKTKEGLSFDSFPFGIGNNNNDNNRGSSSSTSSMWEQEMGKEVASLSGMLNVEALINVAAANETEEEIDLLLPNINDLRRTIDTETSERVYGIDEKGTSTSSSETKLFPFLDNALKWEDLVPQLQKNILQLTDLIPDDKGLNVTFDELVNMVPDNQLSLLENGLVENNKGEVVDTSVATEKILQDAIQPLEFLINSTSYAFSPSAFQSLIIRASKALAIQEASGNLTAAAYNIFDRAGRAPRATAEYTAALVEFANEVLQQGYAPLFSNYPSVKTIPVGDQRHKVVKAAEFASLSGAIYEDTIPKTTALGHSIVAQGKTADIGWMVTDSIQYEQDYQSNSSKSDPTLVRTIVLRGYDASDEEVDREGLLNVICTATPVPIYKSERALVNVHEGMLSMAQQLLEELEEYIDTTSPTHKFVLTGHSIGGSLAVLLMILLVNSRGADFVRDRVLRVFTFGSPPIFELESTSNLKQMVMQEGSDSCSILDTFGLPCSLVFAYNQPWDPIIRLFTKYDPLYPLIDDLGEDGYTPWVNGPTRTLRPILKTILESWEGWPAYRDNAKPKLGQDYRALGEQYVLLPEPIRYLTDRLVSVNTAVPPVESIVQMSNRELLPALDTVFKLDVFTISYVSVAIRSFVHHFYPAYGAPVVEYAEKIQGEE